MLTYYELPMQLTNDPFAIKTLLKTFGITFADLHRNREGQLSPKQIQRIRLWRLGWTAGLVSILLSLTIFMPPPIEHLFGVIVGQQSLSLSFVLKLIGVAIPLLGMWYVLDRMNRINHDLESNAVGSVQGQITLEIKKNGDRPYEYAVIVRDERFVIPRKVYRAFDETQHYRLYYTVRTRRLLAAEPLGR